MSHDQWMQWIAEQLMGIREDLGAIRGRLTALEGAPKGRSWAWLANVPWKFAATAIVTEALVISGHMSVAELKSLLGLTRGG